MSKRIEAGVLRVMPPGASVARAATHAETARLEEGDNRQLGDAVVDMLEGAADGVRGLVGAATRGLR